MKLTRQHEIQSYTDGETVVREGEQANDMFVIRSGRIESSGAATVDGGESRVGRSA